MTWINDPAHRRWLETETDRLLTFAAASAHPDGGFGWLREDGSVDLGRDRELWITCRMTHAFALGSLLGRPTATRFLDHGVTSLRDLFRDSEHGGWFASVSNAGPVQDAKEAYGHAFVILAGASATAAGHPGGASLLDEAMGVFQERFWDENSEMSRESFSRDWSSEEQYRGINANMHAVEAFLAAADVTGHTTWLKRAARITDRAINEFAASQQWRLPEHFSVTWEPDLEYNTRDRAHPFRPYGATIGHWFEWARLTVQVAAAIERAGMAAPSWMIPAAKDLYAAAVDQGWHVDGEPGFVYTVDWNGEPVVRERMHWVAAEAIAAAAVLYRHTHMESYATDYSRWWEYAGQHHIDLQHGSWHHELSPRNQVSSKVWSGKPDVYHAMGATLIPRLPVSPSVAPSLAEGNLT